MSYLAHFQLADDYVKHLDTVMAGIPDPFIQSRYTGFLAVSAVTVYELSIKEIFIEFARKKHRVLESFVSQHFERINGRIKLDTIKKDYIAKFGSKYLTKFKTTLDNKENEILRTSGMSIHSSYANIITWRNEFAHEGRVSSMATYEEVKNSYQIGKYVIYCLDESMRR